MKRKRSFYEGVHQISEEEIALQIKKSKLRAKLGIILFYDDTHTTLETYTPSMYTSIEKYEEEKSKANYYININKPIPKDMEARLIAARIELENKGLLEKYTD